MRFPASIPVLLLAASAAATPVSPEHLIEPFVTRSAYEAYCRQLQLSDDQDDITRMLYEDYVSMMADLQSASDERADAAGAAKLADAYEGRGFMRSEELRATRIAVQRSYAENWPEVDRLFDELVDNTVAMTIIPEPTSIDRARGDLRRRVVLESVRRDEQDRTYAGDGLDVIELLRSEELHELPSLQESIGQYAQRANAHVASTAAAERASIVDARVAGIERDNEAARSIMRARVDRWRSLHELNVWAIDSIAYVLSSEQGPAAAAAWRDRARMARFPWLHGPDRADRIADWMLRNTDAPTVDRATAIMESYRADRDRVRREFEELLLSARLEHGVILGDSVFESDPDTAELRAAHLRLTGELSLLESRATEQLESNLTPGQRAAARRSSIR